MQSWLNLSHSSDTWASQLNSISWILNEVQWILSDSDMEFIPKQFPCDIKLQISESMVQRTKFEVRVALELVVFRWLPSYIVIPGLVPKLSNYINHWWSHWVFPLNIFKLCAALKHREGCDSWQVRVGAECGWQLLPSGWARALLVFAPDWCWAVLCRQEPARASKGFQDISRVFGSFGWFWTWDGGTNIKNLFVSSLCGALVVHMSLDASSMFLLFSFLSIG